ncbi:MAG: phage holin family protein [Schlesneria sp.]
MLENEYEYNWRWSEVLPGVTMSLLLFCVFVYLTGSPAGTLVSDAFELQPEQGRRTFFGLSLLLFGLTCFWATRLYHRLALHQRIVTGTSGIIVPRTYWSNDEMEIPWNSIKKLETGRFLIMHGPDMKYTILSGMLESDKVFNELVASVLKNSTSSQNSSQPVVTIQSTGTFEEIAKSRREAYKLLIVVSAFFIFSLLGVFGVVAGIVAGLAHPQPNGSAALDLAIVGGICGILYFGRIAVLRRIKSLNEREIATRENDARRLLPNDPQASATDPRK